MTSKTESVSLEWYDSNVLGVEGTDLDDIIQIVYEQIRATAKATHQEFISATKWELTYDSDVMEFKIRRIFP